MTDKIDWQRVRRLARARYKQLRKHPEYKHAHPSFAVDRALYETATELNVGFGVEGWSCGVFGDRGVDYINMGDPYELTVVATSTPTGVRFYVTCWATFAEGGRD